VFDKFHVAKHLGEAVDRVRRRDHKELKSEGDERLTGTKYDWLRNAAPVEDPQKRAFAQLMYSELKTARVGLERNGDGFVHLVYERPARKHLHRSYN
jgi:transposase